MRTCLSCSSEVEPDEERCALCFAKVPLCVGCKQREVSSPGKFCGDCEDERVPYDDYEVDHHEQQEMP